MYIDCIQDKGKAIVDSVLIMYLCTWLLYVYYMLLKF